MIVMRRVKYSYIICHSSYHNNFWQSKSTCQLLSCRLKTAYMASTASQHPPQNNAYSFILIGHLESCFKTKNGTPRQPSVCSFARARLKILKSVFQRPDHSLEGLQEFSHVWVIYVFHQNNNQSFTKAKVKPPRLNGQKMGVFACRSPYRPNPIGMTLARLEMIKGDTLYLSGVDIIHGTPVLDIKPFIPSYDHVPSPSPYTNVTAEKGTTDQETLENVQTVVNSETPNTMLHSSDTVAASSQSLRSAAAMIGEGLNSGRAGNVQNVEDCSEASSALGPSSSSTSGRRHGRRVLMLGTAQNIKAVGDKAVGDDRTNFKSHVDCDSAASPSGAQKSSESSERGNNGSTCNSPNDLSEVTPVMSDSPHLRSEEPVGTNCDDEDAKVGESCDPSGGECKVGSPYGKKIPDGVQVGDWVSSPPIGKLGVRFTPSALEDLQKFKVAPSEGSALDLFYLEFFRSPEELKGGIISILAADPRSTYRRSSCNDRLYYFPLDTVHITAWFPQGCAEVLRIQPISLAEIPTKK